MHKEQKSLKYLLDSCGHQSQKLIESNKMGKNTRNCNQIGSNPNMSHQNTNDFEDVWKHCDYLEPSEIRVYKRRRRWWLITYYNEKRGKKTTAIYNPRCSWSGGGGGIAALKSPVENRDDENRERLVFKFWIILGDKTRRDFAFFLFFSVYLKTFLKLFSFLIPLSSLIFTVS